MRENYPTGNPKKQEVSGRGTWLDQHPETSPDFIRLLNGRNHMAHNEKRISLLGPASRREKWFPWIATGVMLLVFMSILGAGLVYRHEMEHYLITDYDVPTAPWFMPVFNFHQHIMPYAAMQPILVISAGFLACLALFLLSRAVVRRWPGLAPYLLYSFVILAFLYGTTLWGWVAYWIESNNHFWPFHRFPF